MIATLQNFLRTRVQSFRHAFSGWWFVIRTQKNAWIHAVASGSVIALGWWLQISVHDWALITVAIGLVWISEFINTSLEAIVDLATSGQQHRLARVGKDVGAAAVLIASICAAVIGLLILGPPLIERLR